MSWSIPQQIEKDIIAGAAQYRTFQTGAGGQSILQVPTNAYVVIFGYDFSPAGGGLAVTGFPQGAGSNQVSLASTVISQFETQQISFYTGQDYFPFVHHVNTEVVVLPTNEDPITGVITSRAMSSINNTPIARSLYITGSKDITISVGLVINIPNAGANAIPITNRTPALLTYGGSPQLVATQTNFGPNATPLQYMQPSIKDYNDFAFGLLPDGANNQAFATPDATNGLVDPGVVLGNLGANFRNSAACNYFLCLHYALYTTTIPEQRG